MEVDIDIFDSVDHSDRGPTPSTSALPYFDPRPTQVEESQMVAVTDKSCVSCRKRKVRCCRLATGCLRCKKRGEECHYDLGASVIMRPEPAGSRKAEVARRPVISPNVPAVATSRRRPPITLDSPLTPPYSQHALLPSVSVQWTSPIAIGPSSLDWQLAQPPMAKSLTLSLLQASMDSCCLSLKAFNNLKDRISYFCVNLDNLSPPEEAAVTILTSLGARASPHSALLGVGLSEGGTLNHALKLSAGIRRESAWRSIVDRAVEQCSINEILHAPTKTNVETLVALANALLFSEVVPDRSRLFHRIAVGLFQDLEQSDLTDDELDLFKKQIAAPLYESDCRIAAYASLPVLLRDSDILGDLESSGIYLPNLDQEFLRDSFATLLSSPSGKINRKVVDDALSLADYFICALQRALANITTAVRHSTGYLTRLEKFWANADQVHGALQSLQRFLSEHVTNVCTDHEHELDLVHAIRLDIRLVDLFNLSYCFLEKQKARFVYDTGGFADTKALDDLLDLSLKRVRKGLKLMGYYSKLLAEGADQHVLYHLITQMDVLPWVKLACQRVGEIGGPQAAEYEVSETELEWYKNGLEAACFFSPLAAKRLDELNAGRSSRISFENSAVLKAMSTPSARSSSDSPSFDLASTASDSPSYHTPGSADLSFEVSSTASDSSALLQRLGLLVPPPTIAGFESPADFDPSPLDSRAARRTEDDSDFLDILQSVVIDGPRESSGTTLDLPPFDEEGLWGKGGSW